MTWVLVGFGAVIVALVPRLALSAQVTVPVVVVGVLSYVIGVVLQLRNGLVLLRSLLGYDTEIDTFRYYGPGTYVYADGRRWRIAGASGLAALITDIQPPQAPVVGGTTVMIEGSGFICTPRVPEVRFGHARGSVVGCGANAIFVVVPPHLPGSVKVAVWNAGAYTSNTLDFRFAWSRAAPPRERAVPGLNEIARDKHPARGYGYGFGAAATIHEIVVDRRQGRMPTVAMINGADFVCEPRPWVRFGDDYARVISCSPKRLLVEVPPSDNEMAIVEVINQGQAASNRVTFHYR